MSSFKIVLAFAVSLLICLGIVTAQVNFHQDNEKSVCMKISARTCTCSSSSDCLPWCSCQSGFCRCGGRDKFPLTGNIIKCRNNTSFSSSSSLKECHCLTSDSYSDKVYVGRCAFYTCGNFLPEESINKDYFPLLCSLTNISSYLCARLGRKGRMCGYCGDGLSRYVLSYNISCINCQNARTNWWKVILLGFGPLTCFYVFVLVFHVNITSSRMQAIVLFSQIITASAYLKMSYMYLSKNPWVFLGVLAHTNIKHFSHILES